MKYLLVFTVLLVGCSHLSGNVVEEINKVELGKLSGQVTYATWCRQTNIDECTLPRPLETRTVNLMDRNSHLIASIPLSQDGKYEYSLKPGDYVLDIQRDTNEILNELPIKFSVAAEENVVIDAIIREK